MGFDLSLWRNLCISYSYGMDLPCNERTPEGKEITYPIFEEKQLTCSVSDLCSTIGAEIPMEAIQRDLQKMQLFSEKVDDDHIRVTIPITRSDVIHAVDVYGERRGME